MFQGARLKATYQVDRNHLEWMALSSFFPQVPGFFFVPKKKGIYYTLPSELFVNVHPLPKSECCVKTIRYWQIQCERWRGNVSWDQICSPAISTAWKQPAVSGGQGIDKPWDYYFLNACLIPTPCLENYMIFTKLPVWVLFGIKPFVSSTYLVQKFVQYKHLTKVPAKKNEVSLRNFFFVCIFGDVKRSWAEWPWWWIWVDVPVVDWLVVGVVWLIGCFLSRKKGTSFRWNLLMRLDSMKCRVKTQEIIKFSHESGWVSQKHLKAGRFTPHFPRRQRWQLLPEGREEWSWKASLSISITIFFFSNCK